MAEEQHDQPPAAGAGHPAPGGGPPHAGARPDQLGEDPVRPVRPRPARGEGGTRGQMSGEFIFIIYSRLDVELFN